MKLKAIKSHLAAKREGKMKQHNNKRSPCASCVLPKNCERIIYCVNSKKDHMAITLVDALEMMGIAKKKDLRGICPFNELRKEMKKRLLYGDPDSHPKGMV